MNIQQKIAVNTATLYVSKILSTLFSVVISVFLIRYLGNDGFGKFSIVFAYLSFFQILTSGGIDTIVIKEIVKNNARQDVIVGNAVIIKLLLSLVAVIISWSIAQFLGYPGEIKNYIYIASFGMLFSFNTTYTSLLQAHFRVVHYTVFELILTVLSSALIALLIFAKSPILHFVIVQTIFIIPQTAVYLFVSKKIENFKFRFGLDKNVVRSILTQSWPIALTSLYVTITLRIDQLILFKFFKEGDLGLYSAIVKLVESLNIIPGIFIVSLFPLLCSSYQESPGKYVKIYRLGYKYLSIIIIPICFAVSLLSEKLILLIYGNNFIAASGPLSVLIWSELFAFLGTVHSNILFASGQQKYVSLFSLIGVVSNIAGNIILIPRYGIYGASITTVISYSCLGLIPYFFIKDVRTITYDYLASTLKPILSSVPMVLFIYYFSSQSLFFLIACSLILYVLFLLITKSLGKEDLYYVKQIVNFPALRSLKVMQS